MASDTENLKPCPFCGQKLEFDEHYGDWRHIDNGCFLSWIDSEYGAVFVLDSSDEIEAWNRRAEEWGQGVKENDR